jgi:hypothetical protein
LQSFAAFLIIWLQSIYLTLVHSAHVYYSSAAALSKLGGKLIGFVRDRTSAQVPVPIKLPPVATFDWKQLTAVDDPEEMQEYYDDNATGCLWALAKLMHRDPFMVPRILVLPTIGFKIMHLLGPKAIPHELQAAIQHHITSDTTEFADNDSWCLVLEWLLCVEQIGTTGASLVVLAVEPVLETDKPELLEWMSAQLNITLGPEAQGATMQAAPHTQGPAGPTAANLGTSVGRSIIAAVHSLQRL